jgi:carboxyl-terminal processing protease
MKQHFAIIMIFLALALVTGCRSLPTRPHQLTPPRDTNSVLSIDASEDEAYRQIRILTKTMLLVRQNYVDESKVSYSNLVSSALKGMLQSLDPFSQYLEPIAYKELQEETQGKFGGIGIQISIKDNTLTVISPIDDTPAYRAGILSGDKIVEINSNKTDSLDMRDAIARLRGTPGTPVSIRILRGGEFKDYTLTREEIKIASVKGTRMLDENIGYIRITEFSNPTAPALRKAVEELLAKNMKALVLDQRNNPGGLLSSSIEVSEMFLPKGAIIVSTRGRGTTSQHAPAKAGGPVRFTRFPMVILVNGGSASAAEIVSGALHDNKRAVLVGETTFGKGSVQNIVQIEDGAAARITTAHYYTPSGRCIHEKGIEPDISVPVPPEEWQQVQLKRLTLETPNLLDPKNKPADLDKVTDRQLDRAVDLLKGLLIFKDLKSEG